ncbi:MAG: ABC transporter permease, partial [Dehalococcoidia bacterium]
TAPAWVNLSLSRISRDPLPYGSLTVIVMMAAALGIFGAAFQTTLSQSQEDQALYDVGGDLVLTQIAFPASTEGERYRELLAVPGVLSVSPLLRDRGNLLGDLPGSRTKILAVDPVTLPEAAWFREDFTTPHRSLAELLVPLRSGDSGLPDLQGNLASGIPIPTDAEYMGIWVNTENLDAGLSGRSLTLYLRLRDAGGRYRDLSLGGFDAPSPTNETADGWWFMEAQLPTERVLLQLPLSLVSVFVSGSRFSRMPPGSISLDDITTRGVGDADAEVIEGFEQPGRWILLPHDREEPDGLEFTAEAARSGRSGLAFSWVEALETLPRGVLIPPGPFPIPAIGGAQFQKGQRIRVKNGAQVVPMLIRETTQLFPTVEDPSEPFLVVPLKAYQQYIQRLSGGKVGRPEELWVSVEETADRDQTIAALRKVLPSNARIRDRKAAVDLARRNPLAGGGWNGLTLLSITTLTMAVLIALATHAVVSIRAGRVELTVVRTLGFSRMQIFLGLAIERVVVSLLGLIMGGAVGYLLARWVLGLLDQNARGQAIVPPAIFATQGWIIAVSILCLVLASLAAIFLAVWSAGRLKPSDVLRSGE